VKILRGQTGSSIGPVRVFPISQGDFLILAVMSLNGAILRMIAVINNFLDLIFDLLFADGAVGIG
jgi:hypothetical protein